MREIALMLISLGHTAADPLSAITLERNWGSTAERESLVHSVEHFEK
jgi:hypothetical protein